MPLVLCVATTLVCSAVATANNDGGGNDGGNDGGGDINFGQPIAGVDVDASGVLKVRMVDPRLARARMMQARRAAEVDDVMQRSELRKVSLNRLEKVIGEHIEADRPLSDDVLAVAGLTSVRYVFYYPDTKDIVIAGPAEGFVADPTDRFVGIPTGRPTVLLEDLATALRA